MRFSSPEVLYALLFVPLLFLFFLVVNRSRRRAIERLGVSSSLDRFSGKSIAGRLRMEGLLFCVTVSLLIVALAKPQAGTRLEPASIRGSDIYIAIDLSRSMSADDAGKNRLERAKISALELVDSLQGDRAGLILFANDAFVQCPLTHDYAALTTFIHSIGRDTLVESPTSLAAPLETSMSVFSPEEDIYSVLVILSDGEHREGDLDGILKDIHRRSIRVFTIGVGSEEGVPIPVVDEQGRQTGYVKDGNGKVVISSLGEATLRHIAESTGGYYFHADDRFEEVDKLLATLETLKKREIEKKTFTVYEERYQIPLGLAMVFFLLYLLVMSRTRRVVL